MFLFFSFSVVHGEMAKLNINSGSPTFPTVPSPTAGLEVEVSNEQGASSSGEPTGEADSDNSCKYRESEGLWDIGQ
mgnify:FL=1